MQELFSLLTGVGANITYLETEGHLPVKICGRRNPKAGADQSKADGNPLQLPLDISKSTQFLSALLLISPMIPQGLDIHITSEKTDGSYIRITRKMLADAGVEVKYDGKIIGSIRMPSTRKNIIRSNRMFRQRVIFMRQLRSQAAGHL